MDPRTQRNDLKEAISLSDSEMEAFRKKLKLTPAKPKSFWLVLPALGVATLLWFLPNSQVSWDLSTVQRKLESPTGQKELEKWAHTALNGENKGLAKLALASIQSGETGWQYALQGLEESADPELRFAFLEILLDQFDEQPYPVEWVDNLMEKEQNLVCLALLNDLLFLAENNS